MCRQRKTTLIQVLGTVRRDIFPSLSNLFRCGLVDSLVCQFSPKRGIIGAHQQLSQGLGIRTVSLVPYPSSVGSSRHHLYWHHQKQEATSNKVHHCLCSSRGEASAPAKVLGWAACNSKKLAVPGRPTGLRFHHSYRTHAKHGPDVCGNQESGFATTNYSLGRTDGGAAKKEESLVFRSGSCVSEEWVESPL